jgi:hypothetical protein
MANLQRVTRRGLLAFLNETTDAPDLKHDQDLRDTCVILLDRAGNDPLSIWDVTGHTISGIAWHEAGLFSL